MKILVISQYYYPEPFKIHEICEELVRRGHQVTVITGRPNYPDGELIKGYDEPSRMDEILNGVHIIRTRIILRGHNPFSLICNYLSYPKQAKKAIKSLNEEFDIVFVYQLSPVFMIIPALYYKKKYGKKVYVYCLDLWPESLKILHINESHLIFKFLNKICNNIYRKCDFISVTSPAFIEYIQNVNGVHLNRINYIPQHGESMFLKVRPYQHQDRLNIIFSGNIGKAQDFDTLIKAVKEIEEEYYDQFKITIIGSGSYLENFKKLVCDNHLNKVFFFEGRKKVEDLLSYYDQASLFFLSLEKDSHVGKTIPSKLQTYMSAGRGIIGTIDGETSKIINESQSGKVCKAGDYKELSRVIIEMINSSEEFLQTLSINSRNYFIENFTLDKYVDQVDKIMEDLINESIQK